MKESAGSGIEIALSGSGTLCRSGHTVQDAAFAKPQQLPRKEIPIRRKATRRESNVDGACLVARPALHLRRLKGTRVNDLALPQHSLLNREPPTNI